MAIDLSGRAMVISGASSGIGAATALACARAGMPVALGARRADRLGELAGRIEAEGGRAVWMALDVADAGACRALVDRAAGEFGGVYGVFANAGYGLESAVHQMSDASLREMFEVNFFGSLNLIRPAVERMLGGAGPGPRGHVLWCSSCLARMPLPYYGVYSATKAAQHHLGRAMRSELRGAGVHVSTVHPIGTKTEFFDTVQRRSGVASLIQHTSGGLMQSPERVARAVVRCLRRPRAEVWTSVMVRWGMALCAAMPGVEDPVFNRMVRRRRGAGNAGGGRLPAAAGQAGAG